jgi:hypothetical protein
MSDSSPDLLKRHQRSLQNVSSFLIVRWSKVAIRELGVMVYSNSALKTSPVSALAGDCTAENRQH